MAASTARTARNSNTRSAGKPAGRSGPSAAAVAAAAIEQAKSKAKAKVGAYTRDDAAIKVALFIETSDKPRAPILGGTFGNKRVKVFLRNPSSGKTFLSFMTQDGEQVATANAVARKNGTPVLAARLPGSKDTLWISLRQDVTDEMLERMGMDLSKLAERETEAA